MPARTGHPSQSGVERLGNVALLAHSRAIHAAASSQTCWEITDEDNTASQRVVEGNGGELIERFTPPAAFGETRLRRYRVTLA